MQGTKVSAGRAQMRHGGSKRATPQARAWTMLWSAYTRQASCGYPPSAPTITAIGVAHSADGANWTKCESNPRLCPQPRSSFASAYVGSPSLVTAGASGQPLGQPTSSITPQCTFADCPLETSFIDHFLRDHAASKLGLLSP